MGDRSETSLSTGHGFVKRRAAMAVAIRRDRARQGGQSGVLLQRLCRAFALLILQRRHHESQRFAGCVRAGEGSESTGHQALGIKRVSLGSLSESAHYFDPERLQRVIQELAGRALQLPHQRHTETYPTVKARFSDNLSMVRTARGVLNDIAADVSDKAPNSKSVVGMVPMGWVHGVSSTFSRGSLLEDHG